MAAAGDERYLVCAAVAAAVGLPFFLPHCKGGFELLWVCLCLVVIGCFGICAFRSHCHGCMNVAWAMLWGGSQSTKPCVFPCKVAAAGDERYLVCAAGAAGVVWFLLCVLQRWLFLCA